MIRNKPEIVVTTPESLYLLVTSARGRELLGDVRTVIVDEIHALARDKRGSHLALTLERLDAAVCRGAAGRRPVRIGLSATQRPISTIARLLVGAAPERSEPDGSPVCRIVDVGHRRPLDMAIVLPDDELGAVFTNEQLATVSEKIAEHVRAHRTTFVFVNTRRMAERIAHRLGELVGDDLVQRSSRQPFDRASAPGREPAAGRRLEGRRRHGIAGARHRRRPRRARLPDRQPRAISTWLQRVGRAQHHVGGMPKGRLYPMTRDELVECVGLFAAVRRGVLDATFTRRSPPRHPCPAGRRRGGGVGRGRDRRGRLAELVRRATPYADLDGRTSTRSCALVSDGCRDRPRPTWRHLHRDRVNASCGPAGVPASLRPRRVARSPSSPTTASSSNPEDALVGTVNEDWAIEAMAGDVFLLGSHSWRIRRVEAGHRPGRRRRRRPTDDAFWLGEAPARTDELRTRCRSCGPRRRRAPARAVRARPPPSGSKESAGSRRRARPSRSSPTLLRARTELGVVADERTLVFERFFDDTGGMQFVASLAPRRPDEQGSRAGAAKTVLPDLRLRAASRRQRRCRSCSRSAPSTPSRSKRSSATSPPHRRATSSPRRSCRPRSSAPVGAGTWPVARLAPVPRVRPPPAGDPADGGRRPDGCDLPALAACQENVGGPIEIPDHPIVRQTLHDCFTEAMDLAGLTDLVGEHAGPARSQSHCHRHGRAVGPLRTRSSTAGRTPSSTTHRSRSAARDRCSCEEVFRSGPPISAI